MQFFFFVIWRNDNYPWWNNKLVLALISQGVWGYLQYIVLFYLLILGFSLLTLLLLPTPVTTPPPPRFWSFILKSMFSWLQVHLLHTPICCLWTLLPSIQRYFLFPLGVGNGQGGLVCSGSWGHKKLDTTEQLNWTVWIQNVSFSFLASELCVSASERPAPFS